MSQRHKVKAMLSHCYQVIAAKSSMVSKNAAVQLFARKNNKQKN